MASITSSRTAATEILLSADATPGYTHVEGLTNESAKKVSEFLTTNHTLFHTRWKATFHNHMVHHLLALWALGASPHEIQNMWSYNETYQSSLETDGTKASSSKNLKDAAVFTECLGDNNCYADFLRFFEDEVAEKGIPEVIKEYMFKNDDRAKTIFFRMFSDLMHPIIHLGCGLEFKQPSIVAEALAGACVHEIWPSFFLQPAEEYTSTHRPTEPGSLLDILNGFHNDDHIRNGVKHTDGFNKLVDGLLTRVTPDDLSPYLSQFQVKPDPEDLQRKMRDLMYTSMYALAAAQQPGKHIAMDFVTLHSATMSVFYPIFLAEKGLTNEDKARILETGARISATMYAACGSPVLNTRAIKDYQPRFPEQGWQELIHRSIVYYDEGHAAKLIRALYSTEQLGEPAPGFPIAKADLIKIAHMAMDSVERAFDEMDGNKLPEFITKGVAKQMGHGSEMVTNNMTRWVFYGGLENSWNHVPNL